MKARSDEPGQPDRTGLPAPTSRGRSAGERHGAPVADDGTLAAPDARSGAVVRDSPRTAQLAAIAALVEASPRTARMRALAAIAQSPPRSPPAAGGGRGLPTRLKSGIEALSGMSMDHVRVHDDASRPAQLAAHAYAQGSDIFIAPGQDEHLPHEAWHIVQQAQGRVPPTAQVAGLAVNDDASLEAEADAMGALAMRGAAAAGGGVGAMAPRRATQAGRPPPVQRRLMRQAGEALEAMDDDMVEQAIATFPATIQRAVRDYQRRPGDYRFETVLAMLLRQRRPQVPSADVDASSGGASRKRAARPTGDLGRHKLVKRSLDDKRQATRPDRDEEPSRQESLMRLDDDFISPGSPVHGLDPAPIGNEGADWSDYRAAFVDLMNARVKGGLDSGYPDRLKGKDNGLSRLAWVFETLDQRRTCVAVMLSRSKLHVFANHHDRKMSQEMKQLVAAAQDLSFTSETYLDLLGRLTDAVLTSRGNRVKQEQTIERKTRMVTRRLQKALQLIHQFKLGVDAIAVHEVDKRRQRVGRKKHGEMRAADAVVSKAPTGRALQTDVGISKICCAKCALALQALHSAMNISFMVQGAHWHVYDTDTGWPVPEFLKNNPEAMRAFLGDAAYAIYQKFPQEATRVIEGMKGKAEDGEKLTDQSKLATGYLSSEDEYDGGRDVVGSAGREGDLGDSEVDAGEDDHGAGAMARDREDELVPGYDATDGTPLIAVNDAVLEDYLADMVTEHAYLGVAEGQVAASAMGVRADVFNLVGASTNRRYRDTAGLLYEETPLQTAADGNCLLHGLCLIRAGRNMDAQEVTDVRGIVHQRLDRETLQTQVEDVVRAHIQGATPPGLGSRMSARMSGDPSLARAVMHERLRTLRAISGIEDTGADAAPLSSASHSGDGDGTGRIAFNVTYGEGGTHAGILLFTHGHYIRLRRVEPTSH